MLLDRRNLESVEMKSLSGKPKKCKECGESFVPNKPMQKVCSVACAITHAKTTGEAARKRDHAKQAREAKQKLKGRSEYAKEAQQAFNAWVRERDSGLPCISCGRFHQGQWHAGHYRTVGSSPELRFEPLNCHRQCAPCNNHKSGDIVNYRINLVRKIGLEAVEWLEGRHEPKRYTIDDLKAIKAEYKAKLKELIVARNP